MNFDILPFAYIDGVPTFTDSEIMRMYDMMEQDGTAADVFNQGDANNRSEFLALVKSQNNMFSTIYSVSSGNLLGVFWLNRFEMKTARLHFCLFKEGWPLSDAICKAVTKYVYSLEYQGDQLFTMIIGVIKSSLKRVVKYVTRNGAVIVGKIPNYYWDAVAGKSCEATIVYYPREANNESLHRG